jgi:hypothetical protein
MSHRRAEKYFLLALPLIALRLLLPAGLMPTAEINGPALELCSPDKVIRSTPGNPRVPEQGGSHSDGLCPFAAAAAMAPAHAAAVIVLPGAGLTLAACSFNAQCVAQSGPLRTQRSRAPPSNS